MLGDHYDTVLLWQLTQEYLLDPPEVCSFSHVNLCTQYSVEAPVTWLTASVLRYDWSTGWSDVGLQLVSQCDDMTLKKTESLESHGLKHLDYSINSHITPACIRSIRSDRILLRNRKMVVAASFLWNHRKKERRCASSLCNYHVHHIPNVQRCSFVWLFVRHLSQMPRQLVR